MPENNKYLYTMYQVRRHEPVQNEKLTVWKQLI